MDRRKVIGSIIGGVLFIICIAGLSFAYFAWRNPSEEDVAIGFTVQDLGGKIITVGSDAHETKYLASHIKDAYAILKNEIGINEICTFDHMQPIFHKI